MLLLIGVDNEVAWLTVKIVRYSMPGMFFSQYSRIILGLNQCLGNIMLTGIVSGLNMILFLILSTAVICSINMGDLSFPVFFSYF